MQYHPPIKLDADKIDAPAPQKSALARLVELADELCDSVDADAADVGGCRGSLTIVQDIGPLISAAKAELAKLQLVN